MTLVALSILQLEVYVDASIVVLGKRYTPNFRFGIGGSNPDRTLEDWFKDVILGPFTGGWMRGSTLWRHEARQPSIFSVASAERRSARLSSLV